MKTLFNFFSVILIFSLISCAEEEKAKALEEIPSNALAVLRDGKVLLTNNEQQIISLLVNEYNLDYAIGEEDLPVHFTSAKTLEINGTYYIRMKNKDNLTATTLLVADNNGFLKSGGITCITIACATNNGCVPNSSGDSCTPCMYDDGVSTNPVQGDCKKITRVGQDEPENPETGTNP